MTIAEQLKRQKEKTSQDKRELAGLLHELPEVERRLHFMRTRITDLQVTVIPEGEKVIRLLEPEAEKRGKQDRIREQIESLQKKLRRME